MGVGGDCIETGWAPTLNLVWMLRLMMSQSQEDVTKFIHIVRLSGERTGQAPKLVQKGQHQSTGLSGGGCVTMEVKILLHDLGACIAGTRSTYAFLSACPGVGWRENGMGEGEKMLAVRPFITTGLIISLATICLFVCFSSCSWANTVSCSLTKVCLPSGLHHFPLLLQDLTLLSPILCITAVESFTSTHI